MRALSFVALAISASLAVAAGAEGALQQGASHGEKPQEHAGAYPSGELTGVVLDREGQPIEGAFVRVVGRGVEGEPTGLRHARTDGEGRFQLWKSAKIESGELSAWHDAHGVARARVGGPVSGLELVLRPTSVLTGRVRDPDGHPIADAFVLAVPSGARTFPSSQEAAHGALDGTPPSRTQRLRLDGTFAFRTLPERSYDLYVSWGDPRKKKGRWLPLGRGLVPHKERAEPTARLELVAPLRRIAIDLVGGVGGGIAPGSPDSAPDRFDALKLYRLPAREVVASIQPRWSERGSQAVFPIAEPGRYAAVWYLPGYEIERSIVEVNAATFYHRAALHIGRAAESATLYVRVEGPEGTDRTYGFESVVIRDALGGAPLLPPGVPPRHSMQGGVEPWHQELPAGTYRVEATPKVPLPDSFVTNGSCMQVLELPEHWPRQPVAAGAELVHLEAGSKSVVTVGFEAGGHVDLVPAETGAGPVAPRPEQRGRLALLDDAGDLVAPVRVWGETSNVFPSDTLSLGEPAEGVTALPPGTWKLVLRAGQATLFERTVEIVAGEVTRVVW